MRETFPIPALWKRVLATVYGGIDEELLVRLFLLLLLAWLIGLAWHAPGGSPSLGALWLANIEKVSGGHGPALPLTGRGRGKQVHRNGQKTGNVVLTVSAGRPRRRGSSQAHSRPPGSSSRSARSCSVRRRVCPRAGLPAFASRSPARVLTQRPLSARAR